VVRASPARRSDDDIRTLVTFDVYRTFKVIGVGQLGHVDGRKFGPAQRER
jgi:hypothetical protein